MLKVESYKKGIVLSTVFNIFNKGLVFLNGALVAYYFGVATGTDLFFYVYNSVLIIGAFFSSINSSVVIPESMRIRTQEGEKDATGFLNFFIYLYAITIIIGLTVILINPPAFFSAVSNFKYDSLQNNRSLLFLSLPLFGMICIINLLTDILTSHKFFTIPMIVGIINGLFSITYIFLFHHLFGIKSVLYGLLTSYTLNIILLATVMTKYLHWNFSIIKIVRDKRIWKNLGFAQLGNFTSTAASYTPMYILSGFNTGIITALTFALQISSLPTALITTQFSSVAGIKFNELYARRDYTDVNKVFAESANFLHFMMIPVAAFIFFYSTEIIHIILGFTSLSQQTSADAALFLKYLGLLLPLMVINTLISRLFMAGHKIKESFAYQVGFNIVLIVLLYYGVAKFGIIGYPVVMVFTYLLNLGFCYLLKKKYFDFINYGQLMKHFWLLVMVNLVIIIAVKYSIKFAGIQNAFLTVILAGIIFISFLLGINKTFRLNEPVSIQIEGMMKKIFAYGNSRS